MSRTLLVYTAPTDSTDELHDYVLNNDFSKLRLDRCAIYAFLARLWEDFPGQYDRTSLPFNSYFVEVLCWPDIEEEIVARVMSIADSLGLVVFDYAEEKTYFPKAPDQNFRNAYESGEVDQFFLENDQFQAYEIELNQLLIDKGLQAQQAKLIADAESGNPVANFMLANLKFSDALHYVSPFGHSKSGKLELLDKALSYAKACAEKPYAVGQLQRIQQAKDQVAGT